MSNLLILQQKIFDALLRDVPVDERILEKHKVLSAEERIAIYRNNSMVSLLNALRQTYEVCVKIVGDQFFNAMAMRYIKETPSRSPSVNDYGESFSAFIAIFPPAQQVPYLSDVARLEWACHEAYYGENASHFDSDLLKRLSEEDYPSIVFQLPPSATLIVSTYPLRDIWALHEEDYQGSEIIDLDKGGVKLFVWRHGMQVCMDVLQEDEWLLLSGIERGMSVDELTEMFLREQKEKCLPELLAGVIRKGWATLYGCPKQGASFS